MLLIFRFFFLVFFCSIQSQNNQNRIFDYKGEKLLLGDFNRVYLSKNDSLIKINKSDDSRIDFGSYNFKVYDTIIKYGGYGFWSQRNFMYYFDFSTYEWELYPINQSDDIEGSFGGYTFINEERVIFLGGKKVSNLNRLKKILSREVIEFNIQKRDLKNIGELNFNFYNKKLFYKNDLILYLYDDNILFKINPFTNTVQEFKKPPLINYEILVEFNDNQFKIRQLEGNNTTLLLEDTFDDENSIRSYDLYETEILNQTNQLVLILILLVILFFFFKMKTRKRVSLKEVFTDDELKILQRLLVNEQLFNTILEENYEQEISYVHNTRQLNSKLKSISLKLKTKYNTVDNPIVKTKYNKDKRLIMVSLSEEIKKILKK